MPYKPKKPCGHQGCAKLVPANEMYCEEHAPLHRVKEEVSRYSKNRGYDSQWRQARAYFLTRHPLCVECQKHGRYTKATVVDHIVPHKGDMTLFWDESNWQALCKTCHDVKTGREDRQTVYGYEPKGQG